MPIVITFKRYIKGGTVDVYGSVDDALKEIKKIIDYVKGDKGYRACRFILETSEGEREIVVWRTPESSIIAHSCSKPLKRDIDVYKIYYEVFEIDRSSLDFDLMRLRINNIKYREGECAPDKIVMVELSGEESDNIEKILEKRKRERPRETGIVKVEIPEPKRHRVSESPMDVCLRALNLSIQRECPLSTSDILGTLKECGVYFNSEGDSYLCIIHNGAEDCKYLVSRIKGIHGSVECYDSVENIEEVKQAASKSASIEARTRKEAVGPTARGNFRKKTNGGKREARPPLPA